MSVIGERKYIGREFNLHELDLAKRSLALYINTEPQTAREQMLIVDLVLCLNKEIKELEQKLNIC